MSGAPIDAVLDRLAQYKLRPSGRERWRAICPSCGGTNASKLSVGVGDNGAILLRCWAGCSVEQIAGALGLDLLDLFPPRDSHAPRPKRIAMLSAAQALQVLEFESSLIALAGRNLAAGHALTDDDLERLSVAAERVQTIADEVRA